MSIKRYFFAGIAVIFPIFITLYIFFLLIRFTDNILGRFVNSFLYDRFGYKIPGLGLPLAILIIFLAGFISTNLFVRKLAPILEGMMVRIPFMRDIYLPAKQLSKFLFSDGKQKAFKKVVLIRYPNEWSYSIGFITNEELEEFNRKTQEELISVLVSTPPSPFSGPIIFVPKDKIKVLDMTIDQAIKFVVSGGVVSPPPAGTRL